MFVVHIPRFRPLGPPRIQSKVERNVLLNKKQLCPHYSRFSQNRVEAYPRRPFLVQLREPYTIKTAKPIR